MVAQSAPADGAARARFASRGYPRGHISELKIEGQELYRVGIADGVKISVANFPEFSSDNVVRPDGRITVAIIGDVDVVDQTPQEIAERSISGCGITSSRI